MTFENPNLNPPIAENKNSEDKTEKQGINESEINPELEKLREYSEIIFEVAGDYESVYSYFEPMGIDPETKKPRDFKEEKKEFLEKIKTNPDYCPSFYYNKLEELETGSSGRDKLISDNSSNQISEAKVSGVERKKLDLNESIRILDEIVEESVQENNEIRHIISETIGPIKSKIRMLIDAKKGHFENGDLEKAFQDGIDVYSDIDIELCETARKKEKENMEILRDRPEKSNLEKKLENCEFNAEDLKEIMEFAITKGGLENEFKVVIEKGINSINVAYKAPGHPYNVVLIPEDKKVNGIELPQKIAHEMTHVISHSFSPKQGIYLGGRESEIYTEGIAQINEEEIMKDVLGEDEGEKYIKNTIDSSIYYILAMEKAKERCNFAQVYNFIYEKKYQENLLRNGYHLLENKNSADAKEIKEESSEKAANSIFLICKRIFRGFNPKEGGKYFTKDMVYFKGKIAAQKMKEKGEDKYLYMSRIDPILIPSLKKLGAYASEKGLELARSAVKNIWKEKGWVVDYHENKKWFDDNVQTDRHWAYAKEFLDKDLKEMESDKRIEKLYDCEDRNL